MSDLLKLDATAQLETLAAGQTSARALLEASLEREAALRERLNAVCRIEAEPARRLADEVDRRRAAGEPLGRLAGLPMTIKDTIDVAGMPASSGRASLLKRDCADAAVVARVRAEGAVVWGKTNVPVMARDWQSYNRLYGTTNNPWDTGRTPGGSSGGAAAALAAGVAPLEIGSDIGGSLRVPASFCGIFSHKPTYGLVPQRGHVPPAPGTLGEPDLNVVGPMARTVRDLRLLLSIIADEPVGADAAPPPLAGLRLGLWLDEPAFALDPLVRDVVEVFAERLRSEGASVERIASPVPGRELLDAYAVLLFSAHSVDMAPARRRGLQRLRGAAQLASAFGRGGPHTWAHTTLALTASHTEWLEADELRRRHAAAAHHTLKRLDAIIAPIAPTPPFPHDHRPFAVRRLTLSDGRSVPYDSLLEWIALATSCGLPATALPAGFTADGLPIGVQLIGPRLSDGRTLAIAQTIEERLGGFTPPPD